MNWVELIEKRSLEEWAHHDTFIEATNGGIGGVDCKIIRPCLGRLGAYKADVIVVELSLNSGGPIDIDDLFRALTSLPNKPFVIYLDLTSFLQQKTDKNWQQIHPGNPAVLAPKHHIPVVSYRRVMAKYWGQAPFTEELMYPTRDKVHMMDMGQDLVSMMVVDFLQSRLHMVKTLQRMPILNYTDTLCLSNYSMLGSKPQHHVDIRAPWPEAFSQHWFTIDHARFGQKAKSVIVLNTTRIKNVYTEVTLNISRPCSLQIGVELCGLPRECDHHGIVSARIDNGRRVLIDQRGDPHKPFPFKLQRLFPVGEVGAGKHKLSISSASVRESAILVLTGLYCTPFFLSHKQAVS